MERKKVLLLCQTKQVFNDDDEVGQSKLLLTVAPELHTKVKGPYKEGWHEQGNVLEEENHNGGLDKALNDEEDDDDTNDTILLQGYQNNHVDQDAVKESKVKLDTTQECSLQSNQVDDSNKSKDSFLQDALTTRDTTIHMKNHKVDCCTWNHLFQSDHDDVRNRVRKWKDMGVVFVIALLIHPKTLEFFGDLTPLFDSPQEGKKNFFTLYSLLHSGFELFFFGQGSNLTLLCACSFCLFFAKNPVCVVQNNPSRSN